jgi:hypothetical protein
LFRVIDGGQFFQAAGIVQWQDDRGGYHRTGDGTPPGLV